MSRSVSLNVCLDALPPGVPDGELRDVLRAGIAAACREGLRPALDTSPPGPRKVVMMHLAETEAAYLRGLMRDQPAARSVSAAAARLAEAGAQMLARPAPAPVDADDTLRVVLNALGHDPVARAEQRTLYEHISAGLGATERPIVAAQASTGSGKTAIAQAVALKWLRESPKQRVVVSTPTLQGAKTFVQRWTEAQTSVACPPAAILLGQREFVDASSLDALLQDPATYAPHLSSSTLAHIQAWRDAQAGASSVESRWLMDELLGIEERLDRQALCVTPNTSEDDPGGIAYRKQFERAARAQLIVCSHAMLAFDLVLRSQTLARDKAFRDARKAATNAYFAQELIEQRRALRAAGMVSPLLHEQVAALIVEYERSIVGLDISRRRLPRFDRLIVDEAHQLEQSFSNAFTSTVSLRVTRSVLRRLMNAPWRGARGPLKRAYEIVDAGVRELSAAGRDAEEVALHGPDDRASQMRLILAAIHDAIQGIPAPSANADDAVDRAALSLLSRDRRVLGIALSHAPGQKLMTFTPVRLYPHVMVGAGDVNGPLATLWAGVEAAVLLSATLYLRKAAEWSARYQCALLGVPMSRLVEIPVVEAEWLYRPVLGVWTPERKVSGSGRQWLRPPSRKDGLDPQSQAREMRLWYGQVVDALRWIHHTAAGGVLVPCTSHEMVASLGTALRGRGVDVMVASEYGSLGLFKSAILERAAAGLRVLAVGTGGLWTGFDISGAAIGLAPHQDNVITDLAIPRLPFGMNRSLTHRRRVEDPRDPVPHEMLSTALLLQQGIGRLVRSAGLPRNRRIFLLDGRLVDATFDAYLVSCKRVYLGYAQEELSAAVLRTVK